MSSSYKSQVNFLSNVPLYSNSLQIVAAIGLGGSDISNQMDGVERTSRASQPGGGGKKPEDMTPEELHAVLWQILTFRDSIMKKIEATVFLHNSPAYILCPVLTGYLWLAD